MRYRAEVERDLATGTDGYGNDPAPAWAKVSTVPCRWWVPSMPRTEETGRENAVVEILYAMVPLGADVCEADRVCRIRDRSGRLVHAGPFDVLADLRRRTHRELHLRRVGEVGA